MADKHPDEHADKRADRHETDANGHAGGHRPGRNGRAGRKAHAGRHRPDENGDVAGLGKSSWCQRYSAHIAAQQAQVNAMRKAGLSPSDTAIADKIDTQLRAARAAVESHDWRSRFTGSQPDRALANINEVEVQLLRLAPRRGLAWFSAGVVAQAEQHLRPDDWRLVALRAELRRTNGRLTPGARELAARTLDAANHAENIERARVRSFSNILMLSVFVMSVLTTLFVVWGFVDVNGVAVKMCFTPEPGKTLECPIGHEANGSDVLLVAFAGALAAAFAGALSLRNLQGTGAPYQIPMMLLLLRLPVGALSAIIGILLIGGQFVPGLKALDTSPQIVAWALAFGILQETVTRLVDQQGKTVLANIRGSGKEFEEQPVTTGSAPAPQPAKTAVPPPKPPGKTG
ncbi:hypothetical protein LRS74_30655 [Streptomyces sp. LX-29]|uniref:hypothetical protein n=1 Tax=Streptomyces sp. LX-29 TaxID=2900152 RepID=UPI00240DC6BA|nr:hypothetical protein [Streptomyces sp. LX-29]WFB10919.1 hypothetical protein LRS74_30655 [Streptomyces sp. LX-29]